MIQLLILLNAFIPLINHSLEVKFQPGQVLYVYETKGAGTPNMLYTAVVQNMAVINRADIPVHIENILVKIEKNDRVIQSKSIASERIVKSAQMFNGLNAAGALQLYDFQFQTSRYLENVGFAKNDTLLPGEAVVLLHQTFLFDEMPDKLTVEVKGISKINEMIDGSASLKVENYKSKNKYIFPVKGHWNVAGGPSLISHHRWGSIQEFAFDLIKTGTNGLPFVKEGNKLEHHFAYGAEIYAMAAGEIISIEKNMNESDDNLQQPNESDQDYFKRTLVNQQKLLAKGVKEVMGNHIIIKHENGEYSHYLHLKKNSLKVKVGQKVKQGQHIADLGHSGNSTAPHLHFHVTDGPSMAYSRSLPIRFTNVRLWPDDDGTISHIHMGQLVIVD